MDLFKGLPLAEAYELVKQLANGIRESNRVGWTVFNQGFSPDQAHRYWAVADDLSALRWDALTAWYMADSPTSEMINRVRSAATD